jgi:hypothetical protein
MIGVLIGKYPCTILSRIPANSFHWVHQLPLTDVTTREFWLRLPNSTWLFFMVRHDSIIEIKSNGRHRPRSELPIVTAEFDLEENSSSWGENSTMRVGE